ncbi:MAG TPA: hypothetical protein VFC25_06240 [Verrucomicrobiae bacterium]|nr:hypothetical protein [Verrucomicrobiae bacterium]
MNSDANRIKSLLQQVATSSESMTRAYAELEKAFPGQGILDRHNEPALKLLELYRDVLKIAAAQQPQN